MTKERAIEVLELSLGGGMFFTMSELKQAIIMGKDALLKEHVPENEETGTQEPSLPAGLDKAADAYIGHSEDIGEGYEVSMKRDAFKAGAAWMASQGQSFEMVPNKDLRNSTIDLYNDIHGCISNLVSSRLVHSIDNECEALLKMESLMVATQQQLCCIIDYLEDAEQSHQLS